MEKNSGFDGIAANDLPSLIPHLGNQDIKTLLPGFAGLIRTLRAESPWYPDPLDWLQPVQVTPNTWRQQVDSKYVSACLVLECTDISTSSGYPIPLLSRILPCPMTDRINEANLGLIDVIQKYIAKKELPFFVNQGCEILRLTEPKNCIPENIKCFYGYSIETS